MSELLLRPSNESLYRPCYWHDVRRVSLRQFVLVIDGTVLGKMRNDRELNNDDTSCWNAAAGAPKGRVLSVMIFVPFDSAEANAAVTFQKSFLFFRIPTAVFDSCFRAAVGPVSLCVEQPTSWLLGRRARDHVSDEKLKCDSDGWDTVRIHSFHNK